MIDLYLCIYLLIFLLYGTIGIFYLLGILIIVVISFIKNKDNLDNLDNEINLDMIEENYFNKLSEYKYSIEYMNTKINEFEIMTKTILFDRNKNKNIIFIHGTNSGSICWINLVNLLIKNYDTHNIYLMCLPGAGCSSIEKIDDLLQMDSDYIIKFYSEIIHKYIEELKIDNITLIGHSLATYFILNFLIEKNKNKNYNIESAILINPISIISSVGYQGFYTVFMLKYGILNKFFNLFGKYLLN